MIPANIIIPIYTSDVGVEANVGNYQQVILRFDILVKFQFHMMD